MIPLQKKTERPLPTTAPLSNLTTCSNNGQSSVSGNGVNGQFKGNVTFDDNLQVTRKPLAKPANVTSVTSVTSTRDGGPGASPVTPRPIGEILDDVRAILKRYVTFQYDEQADVISLWVAHTWAFEAADFTPYLRIFSAECESGKSRLLEVLKLLVKNGWHVVHPSVPVLFRRIDRLCPTLLYEESDSVGRGAKNTADAGYIVALLNEGYHLGAKVPRCVGEGANIEDKDFEVFCPKALAGIGDYLDDTTASRSIPIELVRQSGERKAERFREREARERINPITDELKAWVNDLEVIPALLKARPDPLNELKDRQQDTCEPLLAIADMAGDRWRETARKSIVKLCKQQVQVSIGVELLTAIKTVFDEKDADSLPTKELLEGLISLEAGPWVAWFEDLLKKDKFKTAGSRLAKELKRYKGDGIQVTTIRVGEDTAKGYKRQCFEKAWKRYLPPPLPSSENKVTKVTKVTNEHFTQQNECYLTESAKDNVTSKSVTGGGQKPDWSHLSDEERVKAFNAYAAKFKATQTDCTEVEDMGVHPPTFPPTKATTVNSRDTVSRIRAGQEGA